MPQIIVKNLSKTFTIAERNPGIIGAMKGLVYRKHRKIRALDSISFTLNKGELVGYIGPNGAGKSTTVKVLSGILVPDSGRCEVMGYVPWKQRREYVGKIGVVFGQRTQLWWDLPVIESFELLKEIYRIDLGKYKEKLDQFIELLEIDKLFDVPVRQLSLGQRMRCDLTASLLHSPELLFLDEPTIGLDAPSKIALRNFIREINQQEGVTVILTTHDMDDIEALCSRVMVIGRGKILYDGDLSELRRRVCRERRLVIHLVDANVEVVDPFVKVLRCNGSEVHLSFDPDRISAPKLISRITSRYAVKDLFVENPPIEEVIARLYEEQRI